MHSITADRAVSDLAGTTRVRRSPGSPRRTLPADHEGGHLVWRVQCGDMISRERCVTVFVDDDEVVLVGPPGETARLTAGQLGQLRTALNEAAKLAER